MVSNSSKIFRLVICFTSLCVFLLGFLVWYSRYQNNAQDNAGQIEVSTEHFQHDRSKENIEAVYQGRYEQYAELHRIQLFSNELPPAVEKNVSLDENENGDLVLNDVLFHEVLKNQVRENNFGWQIDLNCFVPVGITPSLDFNIYAYWESEQIVFLCLQSTDKQHISLYVRDN